MAQNDLVESLELEESETVGEAADTGIRGVKMMIRRVVGIYSDDLNLCPLPTTVSDEDVPGTLYSKTSAQTF